MRIFYIAQALHRYYMLAHHYDIVSQAPYLRFHAHFRSYKVNCVELSDDLFFPGFRRHEGFQPSYVASPPLSFDL
jgi:hypothetical protein